MSRRRFPVPRGRSRQVAVAVSVVLAVGAGGWLAGTRMQSPADAAAAHRPPKAGPVTVAVEHRKLTASVVAQGTVEYDAPQSVSLAGPVGTADSASGEPPAQIVTGLPKAGAKLTEGSVLMQVSGRPVYVLRGPVPMYRTLRPGVTGDDVSQLQSALRRLGHDPGGTGGHYGQGTAAAVAHWYRSKGFQAQSPTAEDEKQRGDLEQAVTDAQIALLQAQSGGAPEDGDGGKDTGEASAPSASGATHALELQSAQHALNQANKALSAFQDGYGTKVPAGEVVFLPKLPVRVDKVQAHLGDTPDGPVATVTGSDVLVRAVVPAADAGQLRQGMTARIETTDGRTVTGVIAKAGGAPRDTADGDDKDAQPDTGDAQDPAPAAADPSAVPVTVSVGDPAALRDQAGSSVKITVDVGSSKGAVLVVPTAAVHTTADGRARLRVRRGGQVVDVPVSVGLAAAGQVEVTPHEVPLDAGDQVVVGQ
ncbi:peptidoglycan-binding protein [Streptomyces tendae]